MKIGLRCPNCGKLTPVYFHHQLKWRIENGRTILAQAKCPYCGKDSDCTKWKLVIESENNKKEL